MTPRTRPLMSWVAGALAAAALLLLPALPAAATPQVIDPECADTFGIAGGIMTVVDPSEALPGLPSQVTVADMSCILKVNGQQIYVYLTDSFAKFTATVDSLIADGWSVQRTLDDGTNVPFDRSTLASFEGSSEGATISAQRGNNPFAVFYTADAETSQFLGAGTFIITLPLVDGPPAASGTTAKDPSTISELRTIADSAPNPVQSGVLVVTASLLTLLLGLPAYLLSTVLSKRYTQWFGWLERGRIGRFRQKLAAADGATSRRRWLFLVGGMIIASLIASFVDPQFGFNGMSARLFLTLLVSFAVFNIGAWAVITVVLRTVDPAAKPTLTLHPATLLAVAIAVLLSRLLDFSPGIVFGLVAGITFAVTLVLSREALVILVGSGYAAAVALIAWILYSVLHLAGPPSGVLPVALSEFFGSITLEGVSTLPLALIPLATLDGAVLFRWRKWAWALCYAGGIVLFTLVLFTVPGNGEPVNGDFLRWLAIFAVFAVVAVGVWLGDWLARRRPVPAG